MATKKPATKPATKSEAKTASKSPAQGAKSAPAKAAKAPAPKAAAPKAPAKASAKASAKAPRKAPAVSAPPVGLQDRVEAVRMLQRQEGHFDCFAKAYDGFCDQLECCYREECLDLSRRITA